MKFKLSVWSLHVLPELSWSFSLTLQKHAEVSCSLQTFGGWPHVRERNTPSWVIPCFASVAPGARSGLP